MSFQTRRFRQFIRAAMPAFLALLLLAGCAQSEYGESGFSDPAFSASAPSEPVSSESAVSSAVSDDSDEPDAPSEDPVEETDPLTISEIMTRNTCFPVGGLLSGWIELHNGGEDAVNLSRYCLSDREDNPYLSPLPAYLLRPDEYLVLPCGGSSVSFSLDKKGGTVFLSKAGTGIVRKLSYGEIKKNRSLTPEGVSETPSPGQPNSREGMMSYLSEKNGLVINEVLSSNTKYNKRNGAYWDMVEICNRSDREIRLSDYCLTDKPNKPERLRLPDKTLAPGEYCVLYLDGTESDMGIDKDGEALILVRSSDGYVEDGLLVPALPTDVSYGRTADGAAYFELPTFGEPNGTGFRGFSKAPVSSTPSGIYDGKVSVFLSGDGDVFYTTDGTAPTADSRKYEGEEISFDSAGTLRAVCREEDSLLSDEAVFTYLVNIPDLELPVLSVTVDEDAFFGTNGVWNTQKKTELEAHATYLKDGKEEFSVGCGVKLFGLGSVQFAKKSIQLKFKKKYGLSKLNYDVFEDGEITSFDSLVVRAGGQGMWRCILNDEFVSSYLRSTGNVPSLLSQKYRPVNLYVNGRYMGLYCFREKIDEDFLSDHTGYSEDSMSLVFCMTQPERGTEGDELADLLSFIERSDLRKDENYAYVKEHFDVENIIDFFLCEIWCGNIDTLNVRMYKSSEGDGRWRFIFYDLDRAFYYLRPAADLYLQSSNVTTRPYSGILYRLLKNEDFRALFYERLEFHVANTFSADAAVAHLQSMMDAVDHDIRPDIERWKGEMTAYPQTYEKWVENCRAVMNALQSGYGDEMIRLVRKNVEAIR